MKLKIRQIVDNGTLDGERVIIDVKEDEANLSDYILLDTTYFDDGKVSNKHRHSYWFPNQPTENGDIICVYTRAKKTNELNTKPLPSNNKTCYFYFMNEGNSMWNADGDLAILIEINDKDRKRVSEVKAPKK